MTKSWETIRKEVLALGFEPAANYEKQKEAFVSAYNWAQNHIASVVGCLLGEITIDKTKGENPQVYDLHALAEEKLGCGFMALAQTGVINATTMQPVDCARITDNRFLTLPADYTGSVKVYFIRTPQPIYAATAADTLCELPYKWAMVLPYYMANRLFLEDDAAKASYYCNLAEDMKNDILAKENQQAVTVTGGENDGWWNVWAE